MTKTFYSVIELTILFYNNQMSLIHYNKQTYKGRGSWYLARLSNLEVALLGPWPARTGAEGNGSLDYLKRYLNRLVTI